MLRGPYDGICVKKEGTLETASENIEKIFNLNLELLSVLKYMKKFSHCSELADINYCMAVFGKDE